ncbi:MAG: type II methionyl aminopeptidase, partial [Candidatus Thorarchaeota archaeon]
MSKENKTPTTKKSSAKTADTKITTKTVTKAGTTSKKPSEPAKKTATVKSAEKISAAKKSTTTSTTIKKPTTKKTVKETPVKKVVKKKAVGKAETEGPLEKYLEAGKISIQVKDFMREKVKIGASVLELCEAGEAKIVELGGKWAFPLNISINNIAAHYSSPPDDDLVIQSGDIVKVDCGVHIDGYVADTAFTLSFGSDHADLIKASEEATKAAIDMIRPGITTDRLGEEIETIIRSYGYRPIRDLTGHQLDQNMLHGPIVIPNIKGTKGVKLEEGQAFAIETFATTGTGGTHPDETKCFIYQLMPFQIGLRIDASRKARKVILSNYKDFPFNVRWIAKEITTPTANLALKDLSSKGQIRRFPALCDIKGAFVSQSEHTVYLTDKSRVVTTLPNQ